MIKKLNYQQINFRQYQNCIQNAVQKNFYAKKEILDALCENWELLVMGDYDFVMPVPVKKKWGFSIVVMPLFCQQLGVFGKECNKEIEQQFLNFFLKEYRILTYAFNFQNSFSQDIKKKKNYIIETTDYQLLRKNYFKGRKSTVKTAQYLNRKVLELSEVLPFIKNNRKGLNKKRDAEKFFNYLHFLHEKNKLQLFGSFKENHLTNLAIVIDDENQYALLGLINNESYRLDNGASFLVDRILQETIHEKLFDFMGGSIRGIEVFFKSFGSQLQEYPIIENSKIDFIKNFFIK